MRYEGSIYRPPSESDAYILQATVGCSWNRCVYCDMYRQKQFRVRSLADSLEDIERAATMAGTRIDKVFVADGDALMMETDHWLALLERMYLRFPRLRRVSCYAMASNILEKSQSDLDRLAKAGLSRLYIGPESGDDVTLKQIAKGSTHAEHVQAAQMAHHATMEISMIALLGIAGVERSQIHAQATGELVTAMDPQFFAALTTTVVAGTPLAKQQSRGRFSLPSAHMMLNELRTMIAVAHPTNALFRTNHASNYVSIAGRLPADQRQIMNVIDSALAGSIPMRPEWARGL